MKKKMFKAFVIALAICVLFVCSVSPASAVSYGRTVSSYPGSEECYGESIIYPVQAHVSTYCELASAKKWVTVNYYYSDDQGHIFNYTAGNTSFQVLMK